MDDEKETKESVLATRLDDNDDDDDKEWKFTVDHSDGWELIADIWFLSINDSALLPTSTTSKACWLHQ